MRAQEAPNAPEVPSPSLSDGRSLEDLNLVGADAVMPPISDSILPPDSDFRRALFSKGMVLRLVQTVQYAQNTLQAPVPADEQKYVGEAPFAGALEHLLFTADLRQLHLRRAQFYGSGVWNWVSWNPAGPKTFQIWDLCLYKAFGEDRVEVKAGYISNNLEFTGMLVGGSTGTAAQGVYAILPFEVGLSYFPLATPSLNVRIRGPKNSYLKAGAQRSVDPEGGPREVERNATGFRFIPHGDKLLQIYEVGSIRSASSSAHEAWLRAGYMRNSTAYLNFRNGNRESGNDHLFVLMDYQVRKPDALHPYKGVYVGGSAMTAASRFNAYDRYYEARVYDKAPFRSRPADMASAVAYYTGHSKYVTDPLVAAGKTVWRNSASLTGSYALHVARGQFLSAGLSYIHGPAITPRVSDALTFTASYAMFF
jgi:porin